MEQLGPMVLLALALVGLALIIVTLYTMRRVRGTGRTAGQAEQGAGQADQAASKTVPAAAQVTAAPSSAPTATPSPATPSPALHKAPANFNAPPATPAPQAPAAQPAHEPSYTAIAVAAGGPRPSPPACTQKRVDYSDTATDVGAGASYTAIAVAEAARAARNLPPLASASPSGEVGQPREPSPSSTASDNGPAPTSRNGVGQSYAAVAVATVGEFTPKHVPAASPPRIDYAGAATETTAASSYTAIAVASAARNA